MRERVACLVLGHAWRRRSLFDGWGCSRCGALQHDRPLPRALGMLVAVGLALVVVAIVAMLAAGVAK